MGRKNALKDEKQRLVRVFAQGLVRKEDFATAMAEVGTEIALIEVELPAADVAEEDLSNLLAFAEWLLERVGGIWNSATAPNKQRLQAALFPDGLMASKAGLGTAKDPLFFSDCVTLGHTKTSMASPEGFEPSLPP
jgi:hypothetical protein